MTDVQEIEGLKLKSKIITKTKSAFATLGLCDAVLKAISKTGYQQPTPIQRKVIPVIISGRDVVAMARTGSGKTAAFLLPIIERLKAHSSYGVRVLIISPTRELALQTLKFLRDLGRFVNLVAVGILGGDRLEDQFSALHKSPDIIVATPGRLLHIIVEMNLNLKTVEMVVFDECDRLFEMGFSEQLSETLIRLPSSKQTLLLSATLPSNLVEFSQARLQQPVLLRLDSDFKLSDALKLVHFTCLNEDKPAALLHLARNVIPEGQQAVIFFATKHHAEFLKFIFDQSNMNAGIVHSGLDFTSRNMVMTAFRKREMRFLMVTDLAARGLDMPHLDNVVNYHFPGQAKLFVHRVGRVARAGRTGVAFSLIDPDESPYLFDSLMFLGRQLVIPDAGFKPPQGTGGVESFFASIETNMIGKFPRIFVTTSRQLIDTIRSKQAEFDPLEKCCQRAFKKYLTTRPKASNESVKRVKQSRTKLDKLPVHPLFLADNPEIANVNRTEEVLNVLRNVRVPTIFEALGKASTNLKSFEMMERKRRLHEGLIERRAEKMQKMEIETPDSIFCESSKKNNAAVSKTADSGYGEFFIPYGPAKDTSLREKALSVNNSNSNNFNSELASASMNIQADDLEAMRKEQNQRGKGLVWDRKKKRFTAPEALEGKANQKMIRTESGVLIPATYKSDKYKLWMKKAKPDYNRNDTAAVDDGKAGVSTAPDNITTFSSRYGSVVEFLDTGEDEANKSDKKAKHWRPGQKYSRPLKREQQSSAREAQGKRGVTILGVMDRKQRAQRNRQEYRENKAAKSIKGATMERHHGQVRKPEVIMKARKRKERIEMKMKRGVSKKHNKNTSKKGKAGNNKRR